MKALARTQRWIWVFRHQPLTVRLLAATAALLTAAAAFAAPAEADQVDDDFVAALNNAGVIYGEPGQCGGAGSVRLPDAGQAGRQLRRGGDEVEGGGMSPEMAGMFTTDRDSDVLPTDDGATRPWPDPSDAGHTGRTGRARHTRDSSRSPAGRWSTRCRPSPPPTVAVVMKSTPLPRTTNRPARSSDNTNRSAAATPTPIPISSEPRRQKLAPTNTNAVAKISPTSRIGHWARTPAGSRPGRSLLLGQLDDVGQQERPRQRADTAGIR